MRQPNSPPSDFTRRTLRFWASLEFLYAAIIAAVAIFLIPWKSPEWNGGILVYAALHLAAAPGLWLLKRWGWRVALSAGLLGLLACAALLAALIGAWAYLRGVYGAFGLGASIGALLMASAVLQLLGLYPALLVRALLRREVRADLGTTRAGIAVLAGIALIPLAVGIWTSARYRMHDAVAPLAPEAADLALGHLRAALENEERPSLDALQGTPLLGNLTITLWRDGQPLARVHSTGADLGEAVAAAADELAMRVDRPDGRLEIERITGTAPLLIEHPVAVALSVDPGRDGLRRGDHVLLPSELVRRQLFGSAPLVPGIDELRLGLNARAALESLPASDAPLERVRSERWVEPAIHGAALPVARGNTPTPGTGPDAWRAAAIAGGDFILRQILPDGRFRYRYQPLAQRQSDEAGDYSITRHAGTVYALALLFGRTGEARFRDGAERAMAWLGEQVRQPCGAGDRACIMDGDRAPLGASALTLVGLLEYQRNTDDSAYGALATALAEHLLAQQRADGDFDHVYDPAAGRADASQRLMFYSEESALALVLAHEVLGGDRYLPAAERALDYLTGPKYDAFFLGQFIFGADAWTCIAAEEAWPALRSPAYLDFCLGYADFLGRLQYGPDAWPPGFAGHYGFSALMVPQAPAAAGFGEAIVSTVDLAHAHGRPAPEVEAQMAAALDVLVQDQIRPDNAWMMPDPDGADGGIRRSLVEQEVRIDFTQHAVAALIRGSVAGRR